MDRWFYPCNAPKGLQEPRKIQEENRYLYYALERFGCYGLLEEISREDLRGLEGCLMIEA